jgi:AhpD family alkylhydroperoxidase
MAESPALIQSFIAVFSQFHGSSFSAGERQALLLANAVANRCAWAIAFHSTLALKENVAPNDVAAIRHSRSPEEPRVRALVALTRALVEKRGAIDDADARAFEAAGFSGAQILEVIAGLAVSVMANYAGNITKPPVEEPFRAQIFSGE